MQLSSEDQLRLNVLIAQPLQAVRIDESRMRVHALAEKGEASVSLNPTCKDEKYIQLIRQFLSAHYLGSPGGYPVFLRRWTRMGQARDDSLEKLLLIAEPEAVVAVVHAPGLTDELARRAWWSGASAENARQMLEKKSVVNGTMGAELARFLVEFLPFEEEQKAIIDSVRLVLQPGLVDEKVRWDIWNRGKRKNSYYVGFLQRTPHDLPVDVAAHKKWEGLSGSLQVEIEQGNSVAKVLHQALSSAGQAFLSTANLVLQKPSDQDVVVATLNAIGSYFQEIKIHPPMWRDTKSLSNYTDEFFTGNKNSATSPFGKQKADILMLDPSLQPQLRAMFSLSMVGETLVDPIFGMTDAVGSVMRKKIKPVVKPISAYLQSLQS